MDGCFGVSGILDLLKTKKCLLKTVKKVIKITLQDCALELKCNGSYLRETQLGVKISKIRKILVDKNAIKLKKGIPPQHVLQRDIPLPRNLENNIKYVFLTH